MIFILKIQNPRKSIRKRRPCGRTAVIINKKLSSFIIHDKSNEINQNRYKQEILDHRQLIKSELNKLRNHIFLVISIYLFLIHLTLIDFFN